MTIDVPTQFPGSKMAQAVRLGQSQFLNVEGISSTGQQTMIADFQSLISGTGTMNAILTDIKTTTQDIRNLFAG